LLFAITREEGFDMSRLKIRQVDAFTTTPFSGNPAGVITDADGIASRDMLMIAGEMSLAETSFVTMPSRPDAMFRIRFFTPTEEVDLSGHVTIASCFALIEEGRIEPGRGVTTIPFETRVGIIPVDIHFSEGARDGAPGGIRMELPGGTGGTLHKIMMQQAITGTRKATVPTGEIAAILGVDAGEITGTGLPVEIVSTGLDQLLVPLKHKEKILNLHPDLIKLGLMNKKYGIHTNHIFSLDTYSEECISYARHFAPALGMWEDPATGTAAAGLGVYLFRHGISASETMVMEQGKEMPGLARILVEVQDADNGRGLVRIGGLAVTSIFRTLNIEAGSVSVS
jgi:predicted PhzF superfamily epimerase YddE/YHI9